MPENGRKRMAGWVGGAAAAVALAMVAGTAQARVTQFEVTARAPVDDGRAFGPAGAYERIDGIAHIAIDPASPRGRRIVDLDRAPRNASGDVEFTAAVTILQPVKPAAGVLLYDVPNRGRNLAFPLLNRTGGSGEFTTADPGDGFLMARGYTMVWSGWQAGLGGKLIGMTLPPLPGVTGPSRDEFVFDDRKPTGTATLSYPAADLSPEKAALTVRAKATDPRETPPGLSFRYLDASRIEITRPASMDGGALYEFIYPATGAQPAGLAFIATADVVSFLRGNPGHDAASPLHAVTHTMALGISQSGRFLRDLIDQGFNADEAGRRVFDGAMPHIAGSRKTFTNVRFGQPGRFSKQHEEHDVPGDQFPFSYARTEDNLSGRSGSVLEACTASATCPKVIHTDSSLEFWQARAALLTTAPDGSPLTMPDSVRLFFLAGAPHFSNWGAKPAAVPTCIYPSNPVSAAPTMRALLVAMEDWVVRDVAPPASVYPGPDDLVPPERLSLPRIGGSVPSPSYNVLRVLDHATLPPTPGPAYPALVPKVDADGIPLGGVREPVVAAPLGTYFGWNLRAEGYAPGALCGLTGSFVQFPPTPTDGDSRTPVAARYTGPGAYRQAVRSAAERLVAERLMLPGDVGWVVDGAMAQPPFGAAAK